MNIISNYLPMFIDGMGGIQATGIQMALDVEGLAGNRELTKKIISYCVAALKVNNQKDKQ
ncbi:MAG: hypothetical protein WC346_09570 [Methanogenium sp.]|jgi:hypothetical protein